MNPENLRKFKALFETQKSSLIYSGRIMNEDFMIKTDEMMDDVDFSSAEMEQSMRLRLRNREALFIKKIDEALTRIQKGTFGLCDSCEEAIEPKRLEARPTTTLCVNCKEESERNESLHIDSQRHKSLGAKIRLA